MLVADGLVKAYTSDGAEYTFRPSFARIAEIGSPAEIVRTFADLHGPHAAREARWVLAVLCDQDDVTPLTGWLGGDEWHAGEMPEAEQIILAQHLMRHGIVGAVKPGDGGGEYSERFDAADYIASARVHLELSAGEAEALSMSEFQRLMEMKYPKQQQGKRDVPTREEYDAAMARMEAIGG